MARQERVTVTRMNGSAAARAENAFRQVYAEAFAEPPYEETADDVSAAFRRFRRQVRKASFTAALATTDDGKPVGMAFGYVLGAETGWWDQLTEPVPESMSREDGQRTFGLLELAVRAAWRRQGLARRLHDALLHDLGVERVLLNVHPGSKAALAAYRSWGYGKVGEARPWKGADVHDVMVLALR